MSLDQLNVLSILTSFAESSVGDTNHNSQDVVVYMAENPITQQYYIGATTQRKARRDKHLLRLETEKHVNNRFQKAYNENPNFVWKELPVKDAKTAFDIEKTLIAECRDDQNCLNIKGGAGYDPEKYVKIALANTGKKHSEETKEHLRQTSLRYWSDPEIRKQQGEKRKQHFQNGEIPYQLGMKRSEDFCLKVSEGRKAYWDSLSLKERNELNVKRALGMQKPVIVGDKMYPSRKEAATGENITPPTVKDRIESSNFPDWKWGSR